MAYCRYICFYWTNKYIVLNLFCTCICPLISIIMKHQYLLTCCIIYSRTILLASAQSAQELINSVLNPAPGSEHYSSYSSEIYYNYTLYNQTPVASTNYDKLEASAKLLLSPAAYDYAHGGAGLETTVAANREAYDRVSHQPQVLPSTTKHTKLTA